MLIIIGTAGSREKNIVSATTPAVNNNPTITNTILSARSRRWLLLLNPETVGIGRMMRTRQLRLSASAHDPTETSKVSCPQAFERCGRNGLRFEIRRLGPPQ